MRIDHDVNSILCLLLFILRPLLRNNNEKLQRVMMDSEEKQVGFII